MNTKRALVVGASAPDPVKLIEAINRAGLDEIIIEGFLDDDAAKQGTMFMGYPVIGPVSIFETHLGDAWIVNDVA